MTFKKRVSGEQGQDQDWTFFSNRTSLVLAILLAMFTVAAGIYGALQTVAVPAVQGIVDERFVTKIEPRLKVLEGSSQQYVTRNELAKIFEQHMEQHMNLEKQQAGANQALQSRVDQIYMLLTQPRVSRLDSQAGARGGG